MYITKLPCLLLSLFSLLAAVSSQEPACGIDHGCPKPEVSETMTCFRGTCYSCKDKLAADGTLYPRFILEGELSAGLLCASACNNPLQPAGRIECSNYLNSSGICLKYDAADPNEALYKTHDEKINSVNGRCIECEDGKVAAANGKSCDFYTGETLPPAPAPLPQAPPPPPPTTTTRSTSGDTATVAGAAIGGTLAVLAVGAFFLYFCCFRKRHDPSAEVFDGLKVYSYPELSAASSNFRDVLGDGGSASVYRAELGGRTVAVKKLKEAADHKHSAREFTAEAQNLGRLLHINIVRLLGYSNDAKRPKMLVYEHISGGALNDLLYGNGYEETPAVSFGRRMQIALGVAHGIEYCHHMIDPAIVHRDIKPANILMTSQDENGIPKVADFGLARLIDPSAKDTDSVTVDMEAQPLSPFPEASLHSGIDPSHSLISSVSSSLSAMPSSNFGNNTTMNLPGGEYTYVAGTRGYIDPEYLRTSRATLVSDVYSFGILLMELVMGQRPLLICAMLMESMKDKAPVEVPEAAGPALQPKFWLDKLLEQGEAAVASRVASMLGQEDVDPDWCFKTLEIASQCIEDKGKARPTMRQVVRKLEQLDEICRKSS